ncbi:MAG: inositol monophosphatase [Xanthomonadaceae bacterium]|nr:inositol monophosphatase [Xanthomonadaceae bacterium]
MPRPAINVAVRAARAAGNVILRYINRVEGLNVEEKSRHDYVSEVDRMAEAEIVKELRRAYPDHAILGEETGKTGKSDKVWIVDPLDGTHNYLRGFPHYCVSIGFMDHGDLVYGVIYDPLRDELFTASKGDGAFVNDRRMRVSKRETLAGTILCTGFPPRQHQHLDAQLAITRALLRDADDIRRTGSAALDLAYVAAGRLDGYFEPGLQPWDMAAGCLLVREAGGTFCDFAGRDGMPASGNLVAGNHHLTAAMVKVICANATPELLG